MATREDIEQAFAFVVQGASSGMDKVLTRIANTNNTSLQHTIVTLQDELGRTLLHVASRHGHTELIRLLLEEYLGGDPTNHDLLLYATSSSGDNAIAWATRSGQAQAIQELFLQGLQDVEARNILGSAPIHIATSLNNEDTVQTLLDLGAAFDITNAAAETPLHLASRHAYNTIITRLLDNGAYINAIDVQGFTPLHRATERRHNSTVQYLLQKGADHRIRNRNGHIPFVTAVLAALGGQNTNGVLASLCATAPV